MQDSITITENQLELSTDSIQENVLKRGSIFAYGVLAYAVGVAGLLTIIFGSGNLIPIGNMIKVSNDDFVAILINISLTFLFGLQHTIMARQSFKEKFYKYFPKATERSTFVFVTGIISLAMIVFWQPVGGSVWEVESTFLRVILWCGFVIGWGYLLAATFAINHFDLFGLRQVWLAATNKPYTELKFKESWMYRFSRHPIMAGVLIGLWSLPTMTATQFVLAVTFTVYVFIGVGFEERDLVKNFGKSYLDYKRRVGMFFTLKSQK